MYGFVDLQQHAKNLWLIQSTASRKSSPECIATAGSKQICGFSLHQNCVAARRWGGRLTVALAPSPIGSKIWISCSEICKRPVCKAILKGERSGLLVCQDVAELSILGIDMARKFAGYETGSVASSSRQYAQFWKGSWVGEQSFSNCYACKKDFADQCNEVDYCGEMFQACMVCEKPEAYLAEFVCPACWVSSNLLQTLVGEFILLVWIADKFELISIWLNAERCLQHIFQWSQSQCIKQGRCTCRICV